MRGDSRRELAMSRKTKLASTIENPWPWKNFSRPPAVSATASACAFGSAWSVGAAASPPPRDACNVAGLIRE